MTERAPLFWQVDAGVDALEWVSGLDDGSVALVVTDPAYESLEKHRAHGTTTRLAKSDASSNEWFRTVPNAYFGPFFREVYRVLQADAHAYVMCDAETSPVVRAAAQAAGFTWWNDLVWVKGESAEEPRIGMGYHYRRSHELVVFLEKGKRRIADLGVPDVLACPPIRGGYPTEKPVKLLRTLVRQSSERGELVVDPFAGSGSTGEAALLEGRWFAGCDLSPTTPAPLRLREFGIESRLTRPRSQGRLFG